MRSLLGSVMAFTSLAVACGTHPARLGSDDPPPVSAPNGSDVGPTIGPAACYASACQAQAEAWLQRVREPAPTPSIVSGRCTRVDDGTAYCPDYRCTCTASDDRSIALPAPATSGCALSSSAGVCLLERSALAECSPERSDVCEALCADVQQRLDDDAARPRDAEVLLAECVSNDGGVRWGDGQGVCGMAVRLGEQCHSLDEASNVLSGASACSDDPRSIVLSALFPSPGPTPDTPHAGVDAGIAPSPDGTDAGVPTDAGSERDAGGGGPSTPRPLPDELVTSTPLPVACAAGLAPSAIVNDDSNGITGVALSATHVYWSTASAIYRTPKAGGAAQKLFDADHAGALRIYGSGLFWAQLPALYGASLDGTGSPRRLVDDATNVLAWAASSERLYYMSETAGDASSASFRGPDIRLQSVLLTGGAPQVLAHDQGATDPLAIDPSGLYWREDLPCPARAGQLEPKIIKYDLATASVSTLLATRPYPRSIAATGDRLLWLDDAGIWSSAADGSARVELAPAAERSLVRALATNGVEAYYAVSGPSGDPDRATFSGYADVYAVPLGAGRPRVIACQVYGVDEFSFLADERGVYYRSWIGDRIGVLPTAPQP